MTATPTLALPGESADPTSPRRLFCLFAAIAVMLAVLDVGLAVAFADWRQGHDPHVQVTTGRRKLLLARARPPNVLVIGDSSGRFGVDAAVLGSATGGDGVNACAFGSLLLLNDLWLLEDLAAAKAMPPTVVMVHTLDVWPRDASWFRPWVDLMPDWPKRAATFGIPDADGARQRLRTWSQCWLPLACEPTRLRRMFVYWSAPEKCLEYPDGHSLAQPNPPQAAADANRQRALWRAKPWRPSMLNRRALTAIIALCARHNVNLYLAHGPTEQSLAADPAFQAARSKADAWLSGMAAGNPHVHLLPAHRAGFPAASMQNVDHLADAAAIATYSKHLAHDLRAPGDR